jgi:hypothetical protein
MPVQSHIPVVPHAEVAPHDVPGGSAVPVSMQVGVPVEQTIVPVWQGLAGVHAEPGTHARHVPPMQTPPVHSVPSGALPVAMHTALPVEQFVTPTWHTLGVHATPSTQLHAPVESQRTVMGALPPHTVPGGTSPVDVHPGAQLLDVPVWHTLGVHGVTQQPVASHIPPVAPVMQVAPVVGVVGLQTGAPLLQSIAPLWQGVAGVQLMPVMHGTHAPAMLHTPAVMVPVVHGVPIGRRVPGVQTGAPVEHTMLAGLHGSVLQSMPSWQTWQAPDESHTPGIMSVVVHIVPGGAVDVSTQWGEPVEHPMSAPTWQLEPMHDEPSAHGMQWPLPSHTSIDPHDVPAGAGVGGVQRCEVGSQVFTPMHTWFIGVAGQVRVALQVN